MFTYILIPGSAVFTNMFRAAIIYIYSIFKAEKLNDWKEFHFDAGRCTFMYFLKAVSNKDK
jgi:hypothetical protein